MKSAFTVDLEDWFCSHNLKEAIKYEDWDRLESRVEKNTMLLINLLHKNNTKATFFVLGWIAERFPQLIEIIYREGHEIASHGYSHRQINTQKPSEFEEDIKKSLSVLENLTRQKPKGYRAPAFSITKQTQWALPILKNQGFIYDSSIYPFSLHSEYGIRDVPLEIHQNISLLEIPLSCATFGKFRMPCSGGAYLRFYPFPIFKSLAKKVIKQKRPLIFYIHPWELDTNPPRVALKFSRSLRHYYNRNSTFQKVDTLIKEIEFTSIENLIGI